MVIDRCSFHLSLFPWSCMTVVTMLDSALQLLKTASIPHTSAFTGITTLVPLGMSLAGHEISD